jgi:hypothetical protein
MAAVKTAARLQAQTKAGGSAYEYTILGGVRSYRYVTGLITLLNRDETFGKVCDQARARRDRARHTAGCFVAVTLALTGALGVDIITPFIRLPEHFNLHWLLQSARFLATRSAAGGHFRPGAVA